MPVGHPLDIALSGILDCASLFILYLFIASQDREGMVEEKIWKGAPHHGALESGCLTQPRTGDGERCCKVPLLLGSGLPGVSLLSLVLSLLLYFRTSDLQSRVSHLEADRSTQLPAWLSADQMETAILGRVDQLLAEVCALSFSHIHNPSVTSFLWQNKFLVLSKWYLSSAKEFLWSLLSFSCIWVSLLFDSLRLLSKPSLTALNQGSFFSFLLEINE